MSSPSWPKHRITNPNRLFHSIHPFFVGVLQHIINIPKTLATCLFFSVPHGFMAGCCPFWQKQSLPYLCTPKVSFSEQLQQRIRHICLKAKVETRLWWWETGKERLPFLGAVAFAYKHPIRPNTEFHYITQVLGIYFVKSIMWDKFKLYFIEILNRAFWVLLEFKLFNWLKHLNKSYIQNFGFTSKWLTSFISLEVSTVPETSKNRTKQNLFDWRFTFPLVLPRKK